MGTIKELKVLVDALRVDVQVKKRFQVKNDFNVYHITKIFILLKYTTNISNIINYKI